MIGVAITERNRPEVYARCLAEWRRFLPPGAVLVTVDDASDTPVDLSLSDGGHRFDVNVGVARSKNKCIELLYDGFGCEHYFLSDSDCWPVSPGWWKPYLASPVPHLQYLWNGHVKEARDGWEAKNTFHGCLLYARQVVLDTVGGMRPEFGIFGFEHVEWSRRIHSAGLTPHRYIDVAGSTSLWLSLDQQARAGGPAHASSMGPNRKAIAARNLPLLERCVGSTDYVEFREDVDAARPRVPGA